MIPSIFQICHVADEDAACLHFRCCFDGQNNSTDDVDTEGDVLQWLMKYEGSGCVHTGGDETEQANETKDVFRPWFTHPFEIATRGIVLIVIHQWSKIGTETLLSHQCYHR